jgi:hypothetical protein
MKKFKIGMLALSLFILIGCSTSENPDGIEKITVDDILGPGTGEKVDITDTLGTIALSEVKYTIVNSTLPVCHNTEDVALSLKDSNSTYTCKWLCGRYGGDGPIHVELRFEKNDNLWELASEKLLTSSSHCALE